MGSAAAVLGARVRIALSRRWLVLAVFAASSARAHQIEDSSDQLLAVLTAAALLVSAALYVIGARELRRRSHPVQHIRIVAFSAGWSALAVALLSPLDGWGEQVFWMHMVQHEVLMLLAAPLVVASRPLAAFAAAVPGLWRRVSGWPGAWCFVTSLLAAWVLHALAIWIWHVPRLFDASVTNTWIHAAQHASFLFSALIFWYALTIAQQRAIAIVYLLTTAIHTGVLGALITFAPVPLYRTYAETTASWGLTPLEDQQLGGLIMWVPAGLVFVLVGLFLFSRWLDASARRGQA